ncbi:hypothetical protein QBC44DRAFT_328609 [Cladorrhinum sp. PSN332]|nr:hypothetical protein QBC44DRAFT_328609 [Cladorrhinum sp. PSN332]
MSDVPEPEPKISPGQSVLLWLSIVRRPFRARELWLATQVFALNDASSVGQLLLESHQISDQEALSSLQDLLDEAITPYQDTTDPSIIYVDFSDPKIREPFRYHRENPDTPLPQTPHTMLIEEAHAHAASNLIIICCATVMNLAQIHQDTAASSLTVYAWTHWSTHSRISGRTLKDAGWAGLSEGIISQTCSDSLAFLLALNDFVTEPITLSVIQDQARCTALVKEAQEALEGPISLLSSLVKTDDVAKKLQGSRDIFEVSKFTRHSGFSPHTPSPRKPDEKRDIKEAGSEPQLEALVVDRYLFHTLPLFEAQAAQTIRQLVDTARGLRALCAAIVKSPIYEELLKEYTENSSPLDLLAKAADLLETAGTYPYWDELSSAKSSAGRLGLATTDKPNSNAEILVSTLLRSDSKPHPPKKDSDPFSPILTAQASIPSLKNISPLRYRVARLVYKIRGLPSSSRLGATFTINPFHPPHLARTSSFSSLPSTLSAFDSLLPTAFYTKLLPRLNTLYTRINPLFDSVDNFSSAAFTGGVTDSWPLLKRSLVSKGYRTAFTYFLVAAITHHIRGMLLPWLGQYLWYYPLENLRLATTNPDVFFPVMLKFSWWWVAFMWTQKLCWDFTVGLGMGFLVLKEREKNGEMITNPDGATQTPAYLPATKSWERALDVSRVAYLVWLFSTVEFMFSRGVHTVAWLLAFGKLLFGGDAEHIALGNSLRDNWLKVPFVVWQVGGYIKSGLIPLVWASVVCAVLGQPGLLIVSSGTVGVVVAIIKYRSTFYMALEVSGLFVVGGFLGLTIVMLGLEFWDDPLGIKLSTAMAKKRGLRARTVLPKGVEGKIEVLKRKKQTKSSPVVSGPPPFSPRVGESSGAEEKRD